MKTQPLKTAATKTACAAAKVVEPAAAEVKTAAERWHESMTRATDEYLSSANAPQWQRTLASVLCGVVAACAVYYYGAVLLVPLVMGAVLMFVGPGFLAFVAAVLTTMLLLLGSVAAYTKVSGVVSSTDWAGIYGNAKSRVLGWASSFRRGEVVSAA